MTNTFRKVYKKIGNSGSASDYQLVGNIGVNGIELDIMKGATSSVDGQIGLVPKPTSDDVNSILTGIGIWNSLDTIIENSEKYTALKTFVDNMPIVRAGTEVITNGNNYKIGRYSIFGTTHVNEKLGVTNSSNLNSVVIFMNGDDNAGLKDLDFYSYYDPNAEDASGGPAWGIRFFEGSWLPAKTTFRVNYVIMYFGKRS